MISPINTGHIHSSSMHDGDMEVMMWWMEAYMDAWTYMYM